jgi:hypothetical protein
MLEELTQESFAKRRANFYRAIKKYQATDWKDFDDSPDDLSGTLPTSTSSTASSSGTAP